MAREYPYLLLDVFAETALQGNQLAVFLDGSGLSTERMQALARETNLSETTFYLPEESDAEAARVRIFTVDEELPFAGHPTLGTAVALRLAVAGYAGAAEIALRLNCGLVPVRFDAAPALPPADLPQAAGGIAFGLPVRAEMQQQLPRFGRQHSRQAVAAALGLPESALHPEKPVETVSTGLPFVVAPLVSSHALRGLALPQQAAAAYLAASDGKFFYAIAPGDDATHWRARMQFYGGEDPATGSAAGCATAYLVRHGYAPAGTPLLIEQGVEMGRRSAIYTRAWLQPAEGDLSTGAVPKWDESSYVRVGGNTICVARGRFFLS